HYMSPEQTLAKRVDVDHRADIWSLGVILYELLTLRRPFDGKNLQQIVYEICFKEPVALQRRNPKVPRDLVTICAKALEKDPQNRYQTAADFEADLQRFLRWEPVHAKPVGAWTRASKFLRRHRTETAIATALLLTLTTVLAFFWYRGAVDAQQADALLQTAARSAEAGDYAQAIKLTNRALGLRNDEVTRERLGRYHAEKERIENEAAWKVAESKRLLEHDRETALLLALDAERQVSSPKTRSAVLDALGSGLVARTLPMPVGVRAVDAAFSPSGQHVATAGYGGTLQVFDGDDDAPPRTLTGHGADKPVASVAFVDDDTLISAGMDRTLRIWHPGRVREPLVVPLGEIVPATMVLDQGRRRALLTLYNPEDHVYGAQAFDARSGRELGPFVDHHSYVMAAALRGDGAVAASCCASNRLRIWNVDDGASLADEPLPFDGALASAIAFSADGTLVAIGARDGGISFHDARSGAQLGRVRHSDFVTSLAFSPAGDRLLSGSRDFTARLWAFERQGEALAVREAGTLGGNDGQVLHVAFDRTGTLAATAAGKANGAIRVFDAAGDGGRRAIHEYTIREPVERVAFAPDGRRLLAVTSRRAIVWNFSSARGAISMRQAGKVPALAFAGG
ncbi:MAG: protein kinase, partial [Planctomycetes bacterium]|nr:protein kinase [Planctomycetota bacterium]